MNYLLLLLCALSQWPSLALAQEKTKPAAAHRADPRSAAEIQQANLQIKSFPATNPDHGKRVAFIFSAIHGG